MVTLTLLCPRLKMDQRHATMIYDILPFKLSVSILANPYKYSRIAKRMGIWAYLELACKSVCKSMPTL